jgi:hypothetical protein
MKIYEISYFYFSRVYFTNSVLESTIVLGEKDTIFIQRNYYGIIIAD